MARKSVGYFEGTDARLLTNLICDGVDTLPVSNGLDNHGKHVRLFNEENKIDLLVGYLHKFFAAVGSETTAQDIFHLCDIYHIPILVLVPQESHDCASKKLGTTPTVVHFTDPDSALATARELLGVNP